MTHHGRRASDSTASPRQLPVSPRAGPSLAIRLNPVSFGPSQRLLVVASASTAPESLEPSYIGWRERPRKTIPQDICKHPTTCRMVPTQWQYRSWTKEKQERATPRISFRLVSFKHFNESNFSYLNSGLLPSGRGESLGRQFRARAELAPGELCPNYLGEIDLSIGSTWSTRSTPSRKPREMDLPFRSDLFHLNATKRMSTSKPPSPGKRIPCLSHASSMTGGEASSQTSAITSSSPSGSSS